MSDAQSFWCHEAQNIRCVRESDFDAAQAELSALREEVFSQRSKIDQLQKQVDFVVNERTAAELRNAELIELLKRIDRTPLDRWYRDALNVAVAVAIKTTESGASE